MHTLAIILFILFASSCHSQSTQQLIQKKWDGGQAFDEATQRIEFEFGEKKFDMHYGINSYQQYVAYEIKNDTLIIFRNDYLRPYHRPQFKIKTITENTLVLEAINNPALTILNCCLTPYNDCRERHRKTNPKNSMSGVEWLRQDIELSSTP